MNIFNKIISLLCIFISTTSLLSWDGKLIELKNGDGDKTIGLMVRYYVGAEREKIEESLHEEGFKGFCCTLNKTENGISYILGPSNCMTPISSEKLYAQYLLHFHNDTIPVKLCHGEIPCDKIVVIIVDNMPANTALSLTNAKEAMQRLAKEDPSYVFTETDFVNGKPVRNLWDKFRNFVVNEKFLYAMAGLSALYFGYEYMNQ